MKVFLIGLHVFVCLSIVGVVLLQQGRGADIGAAFGAGGSNTVFGSRGAGNFLTKLTTGLAIGFMVTSIGLGYFSTPRTVLDIVGESDVAPVVEETEVPETLASEPIGEGDVPEGFEAIPAPDSPSGETAPAGEPTSDE